MTKVKYIVDYDEIKFPKFIPCEQPPEETKEKKPTVKKDAKKKKN